jgi:hypothetical protein
MRNLAFQCAALAFVVCGILGILLLVSPIPQDWLQTLLQAGGTIFVLSAIVAFVYFLLDILPQNHEGWDLCVYQNIAPTFILLVLGAVDIQRSQIMAPTRNNMAAKDTAVFS